MKKSFPTRFEGPRDSPGFLLWQATNCWQRMQRDALALLGLTHVQFVLLTVTFWLETQKSPPTQNRLAATAKTDKMMTSQIVRSLEQRKLLKRVRDPHDGRAFLLSTTEEGRHLVRLALPVVEKVDQDFFQSLESTPQFCSDLRMLIESQNQQKSEELDDDEKK